MLVPEHVIVEERFVIGRIILLLQGFHSELFLLAVDTTEFTLNPLPITLSTITRREHWLMGFNGLFVKMIVYLGVSEDTLNRLRRFYDS